MSVSVGLSKLYTRRFYWIELSNMNCMAIVLIFGYLSQVKSFLQYRTTLSHIFLKTPQAYAEVMHS